MTTEDNVNVNNNNKPPIKKKKKKKSATATGDASAAATTATKKKKRSKSTTPRKKKDATATAAGDGEPAKKKKKKKKPAADGGGGTASPSVVSRKSNAARPKQPTRGKSNGTISTTRSAASSSFHNNNSARLPPRRNGSQMTANSNGTFYSNNNNQRPMMPPGNIQPTKLQQDSQRSTANSKDGDNNSNDEEEEWTPPSKLLIFIWCIVGIELAMDLVTTIISFKNFLADAYCCNEQIDMGHIPMAITIPFFLIIVIELGLLLWSIRLSVYARQRQTMTTQLSKQGISEDNDKFFVLPGMETSNGSVWLSFINVLVLLNPFFGSVIAWMLLYQSSETESFIVLGLEGASLLLHWVSVYLEGRRLSWCSWALHAVPVLPFFITVVCILVYLQEGGVCYLVAEKAFWYKGCQVCPDGTPLVLRPFDYKEEAVCEDGTRGVQSNYCGAEKKFCFYEYS